MALRVVTAGLCVLLVCPHADPTLLGLAAPFLAFSKAGTREPVGHVFVQRRAHKSLKTGDPRHSPAASEGALQRVG